MPTTATDLPPLRATNMPPYHGPITTLRPRTELKHGLDAEQLARWRTDGMLILRGVFTVDEMAPVQAEAERLFQDQDLVRPSNLRCSYRESGDQRVADKLDPVIDCSRILGGLTNDRRIRDPLASIFDHYEPRLFKDKLIAKLPGTGPHPLHQDYNWWQGFPTSLISVAVALDTADQSNGCTTLYPGARRAFLHRSDRLGGMPEEHRERIVREEEPVFFEAEPGDVAIFDCFVPHGTGPNTSDRSRRQLFLTYNDSRDGEWYQAYREHFWSYQAQHHGDKSWAEHFFY